MTPAFGWKQDLSAYVDATERMGSNSPRLGLDDLPDAINLLGKHCTIRDQGPTSACVGFADTGAVLARLRFLGYDPDPFSPSALYAMGRQLERVGRVVKAPLMDEGSFPFLVLIAARTFGLVPEREWPFVVAQVNREADFDEFQKASQFRLSGVRRIDAARKLTCMRKLAAGHPIPLGMQVGRDFQNYRKGRGPVGVETVNTGGHMTFLVGYRERGEIFIGCNSWGRDYGDEGFYEIHVSKLEDESTSDVTDITITDTPAPAYEKRAALALIQNLHERIDEAA